MDWHRRSQHVLIVALVGSGGCGACHPEGPATAMEVGAETQEIDEARATKDGRTLWFSEGPGREAILARQRGDHGLAVAQLELLLADPQLSAADRAAATLLRAIEDLRVGDHGRAADRLAQIHDAPALSPIAARVRVLEAQARLDAGDPTRARALADELDATTMVPSPIVDDLLIVQADARARTDDDQGARALYRRYLKEHPDGGRRSEVIAKLARLLSHSGERDDLREAVRLYEELAVDVPLSDYAQTADRELSQLRTQAGLDDRNHVKEFAARVELARIDALLARGRYAEAIAAADATLRHHTGRAQRCMGLYAKGTAVFKQRDRAKARPHFDQAVAYCSQLGDAQGQDIAVKSAYQAARGRYAAGDYRGAAQGFEALAAKYKHHSYVDDAWVLAGESWAEAGDTDRAVAAWRRAISVEGDMEEEARRRLLVNAFASETYEQALNLAQQGASNLRAGGALRAKLLYFAGRALAKLGRSGDAQEAWVEAIRTGPLEYAALQSLSRLRELGSGPLAEGLAVLTDVPGALEGPSTVDAGKGQTAALMLARLGLGEWAQEELRAAKVNGWPAIAVLNQAGLYSGAQQLLASMGTAWRAEPPRADARSRWYLAQPQPFVDLIAPAEQRLAVPRWLTYAVMQTESRFDPRAKSGAGARGLIQLMPATAESVAAKIGLGPIGPEQLYDPATNLELGMSYLARLVDRFGGGDTAVALAIPSYNAGAGAVDRWLTERGQWDLDLFIEAIPYDETRKYTQSVLGRWLAYRVLYGDTDGTVDPPYLGLALPATTD